MKWVKLCTTFNTSKTAEIWRRHPRIDCYTLWTLYRSSLPSSRLSGKALESAVTKLPGCTSSRGIFAQTGWTSSRGVSLGPGDILIARSECVCIYFWLDLHFFFFWELKPSLLTIDNSKPVTHNLKILYEFCPYLQELCLRYLIFNVLVCW
jgi:hypothetical protein